jgi:hypothetical protein
VVRAPRETVNRNPQSQPAIASPGSKRPALLDTTVRRLAEPWLRPASDRLVGQGVMPATTAAAALALGLAAAACAGLGRTLPALGLLLAWRLALSLARTPRDAGADAVARLADLLGRAALPVAFVLRDPANRPTAAALIGALILREIVARRAAAGPAVGAGLGEGVGFTVIALAMVLWPAAFPVLAVALAGITAMSALSRAAFGRAFARAEAEEEARQDRSGRDPSRKDP